MPYPFCVDSKIHHVGLFQLDDGKFQMIKQGKLSPLMIGFRYVIAEDNLADFLKELKMETVEFKKTVIWNRGLDIEFYNYYQLFIKTHFSAEEIEQLDLSGLNMFVMNNNSLFVTPQLKKSLKEADFKYLRFSKGLSFFA